MRVALCLISLMAVLLSIFGCSKRDADSESVPIGASQPLRIVSLAPSLTELAYSAGAGDYLVATVEYSDYPEAAARLPRIGDSFRIDFEQLALLKPDLILVWESGNPAAMRQRLRDLGYNLLVLEPSTLEDIARHVRLIGDAAGTQEIANTAADQYLVALDKVWDRYGASPDTRVFFQISAAPWYTVNGEHMISRIMARCGGQNVFAKLPTLAADVALESVIAADPEIILAPVGDDTEADWREAWRNFELVTAVQNDSLISVDRDAISRSSLRIADGAEQVCSGLQRVRAAKASP